MSFKLGDRLEFSCEITDEMIQKFAEVSGDFNPVHMDEEYAKTTRFGRRIAHGMISAALISRALARGLGVGVYLGQTLKFQQPIFPGDTVTIHLHVTAIRESRGIASVETIVKNQNGEVCVKGDATILKSEFLGKKKEAAESV